MAKQKRFCRKGGLLPCVACEKESRYRAYNYQDISQFSQLREAKKSSRGRNMTLKRYHEEALRNKPGQYRGKKEYLADEGIWRDDRRRRPSGRKKARQPKEDSYQYHRMGREVLLKDGGFRYKGIVYNYQRRKEETMPTENPTISVELTRDELSYLHIILNKGYVVRFGSKQELLTKAAPTVSPDKLAYLDNKLWHKTNAALLRCGSSQPIFSFETPQAPTKIGTHDVIYIANGDVEVGCQRVTAEQLDLMIERSKKNRGKE